MNLYNIIHTIQFCCKHISIYVYNSYRAIDIRSSHKAYSLLYIYSYMLTHCYWRRFG